MNIDKETGLLILGGGGSSGGSGSGGSGSGGGSGFFKCSDVDGNSSTWSGYKAVLVNGIYNFEDVQTPGLFFGGGYTPEPGKVYNADATAEVKIFVPFNYPDGAILYNCDSLNAPAGVSVAGCVINPNFQKYGTGCLEMGSGGVVTITPGTIDFNKDKWTFACYYYTPESGDTYRALLNNDMDAGGNFALWLNANATIGGHIRGYDSIYLDQKVMPEWIHLRVTHAGDGILKVYLDGEKVFQSNNFSNAGDSLFVGKFGYGGSNQYIGFLDNIEVFKLDTPELVELYAGDTAPVLKKEY